MFYSCRTSELAFRQRDALWTGVTISDWCDDPWQDLAGLIKKDPDLWNDTLLFANLGTNKLPTYEVLKKKVAFSEDPCILYNTVRNYQTLIPERIYYLNGVEYKVYSGRDIINNYKYG